MRTAAQWLLVATALSGCGGPYLTPVGASKTQCREAGTPVRLDGTIVHAIDSPFQATRTEIRVIAPDRLDSHRRYPVIYVLPVEALNQTQWGRALHEVQAHNLHNSRNVIFVYPNFSTLPWYADHPTDSTLRQESHFVRCVVGFVEARYPADSTMNGRLLLGFSKSGWGAWSLLLRHPAVFGRAAAWDAPLMMDSLLYGSAPIFGSREKFDEYRIAGLLRRHGKQLGTENRLILSGAGRFRADHDRVHALMNENEIPHVYRTGPRLRHHWESGWVTEAVDLLLGK